MTNPYYSDEWATLYHGDCRDLAHLWANRETTGALVSDVPYGIDYRTNARRVDGSARSIRGDATTQTRDDALALWGDRPALVFGSWQRPRPVGTRMLLVWDTKGALGMGDTRLPWKPAHQEIYVLGHGFTGRRGTDVLVHAPVQSKGRLHPNEKPVTLMLDLIDKCPPGAIVDPFAGSGSTLVAAKQLGRRTIGIEEDEQYLERIARRLEQHALIAPNVSPPSDMDVSLLDDTFTCG